MFICFPTAGGIRIVLTQKVFGLSSVTEIMTGLLLQMVRNWTNLKQLCAPVSPERQKVYLTLCQVICFIICYCGVVSYMALFYHYFSKSSTKFTRHLAFGTAMCLHLAWSCLRNVYHSWMNWTGTDRRKESLVFCRKTSSEKKHLIADASVQASVLHSPS